MLDPASIAIMGGLGLAQGAIGTSASNSANKTNANIAYANLDAQKNQQVLDNMDRQEQRRLAKLPYEDERGNTWVFDNTQGWKMVATPQTKALMNASDREELLKLTQDANASRVERTKNVTRRTEEGLVADDLLSQFKNVPTTDKNAITQMLLSKAARDVGDSFNKSENVLATQAIRGNSNSAQSFIDLATKKAETTNRAMQDARLQGAMTDPNTTTKNNLASLYNLFANRASEYENTQFTPSNAGISNAASNLRTTNIATNQPMQQNAPQLNYQASNKSSVADAIGGLQNMYLGYLSNQKSDALIEALTRNQTGNVGV